MRRHPPAWLIRSPAPDSQPRCARLHCRTARVTCSRHRTGHDSSPLYTCSWFGAGDRINRAGWCLRMGTGANKKQRQKERNESGQSRSGTLRHGGTPCTRLNRDQSSGGGDGENGQQHALWSEAKRPPAAQEEHPCQGAGRDVGGPHRHQCRSPLACRLRRQPWNGFKRVSRLDPHNPAERRCQRRLCSHHHVTASTYS